MATAKCEACGSTFQVKVYHLGIIDLTPLCVQCAALGEKEICRRLDRPTFAEAMGLNESPVEDKLETFSDELDGVLKRISED